MARPKKIIDPEQVRKLAEIGCKVNEIATLLDCSTDTLNRRFAAELVKGRENLKQSLRRWQIQSAQKGNVVMLIWLGKQYLEQTDKLENVILDKSDIVFDISHADQNKDNTKK